MIGIEIISLKNGLNRVKMRDTFLPYLQPSIGEEEIQEVAATLKSGWLTMDPKTIILEDQIAKYVGAKHAIALNSCTAALHLSFFNALEVRR